jgi:hypothetical protein
VSTVRSRLPNRRPSLSIAFEFGEPGKETEFLATVGFDPSSGDVRELFWNGKKAGSALDALLGDMATGISVALQHGVPLEALQASMARAGDFDTDPNAAPRASAMGVALDLMAGIDASRVCDVDEMQQRETQRNNNEQ